MIISCPSCNTRYRTGTDRVPPVETAQCSRCDEIFPLGRPVKPYVLVGPAATPTMPGRPMSLRAPGLAIGMDDPTLADRLGATAFDPAAMEQGAALTYRVQADAAGIEQEQPAEAVAAETVNAPRGRILVPVVLTLLGAVSGWGIARGLNIIPWGATLAGAACGLLVSQLSRPWSRAEN